ncbi:MAG: hypothetical protein IGS03_17010 [Candidatus Sericytochromatia bacterium]|nr:hypothetical protein [Candidatus Sericytochromatia bacterium]
MGSTGIQRTPSPAPLAPSTAPARRAPVAPTTPTAPTGPSQRLQQQVRQSSAQTQQQAQLSSQATLQQVQSQIDSTPASSLSQSARQCMQALGDHPLTQGLVSTGGTAIQTGAKLHDLNQAFEDAEITLPNGESVKPSEKLEEIMESLTEKFGMGETEIPTAEAQIFEYLTGVSTDTMGSIKDMMETGQQVMQVAKTAQCLRDAYNSYGTPEFGSKVEALTKNSYMTLGGKSTVELTEKVSAFCEKCDLDSGKEVMGALAKFSTDDSFVASTERSLLSWATSGSSASGYIGKAVPFLSYGAAAIDTGLAAKTGYDWWQGKASGTDLAKSSITALGSVAGATIAPVVGPLAAAAINVGIDAVGSAYTAISNWWTA